MAVWSVFHFSNLVDLRLDPEYYQPDSIELKKILKNIKPILVEEFAHVTDGIHNPPERVEENGVIYSPQSHNRIRKKFNY